MGPVEGYSAQATQVAHSLLFDSAGSFEELLNFLAILSVLDDTLQVRVAANMHLSNVDVGHGTLTIELVQSLLEVGAVFFLIQLVVCVLGAVPIQDALAVVAVWAVGLAEDDCRGCTLAST